MKKQTLLVALTIIMMACQPKKEKTTEFALDYTTADMTLAEPAACSPPPVRTTVKFVPPVIKDDAIALMVPKSEEFELAHQKNRRTAFKVIQEAALKGK